MDDNFEQQNSFEPSSGSSGGNGLAIASMVMGILAVVFCCCFFYFSIPLGIGSLVTGIIVLRKQNPGKGMAIAGIVTGSVAIVLAIILIIFVAILISTGELSSISPSLRDFEMYLN